MESLKRLWFSGCKCCTDCAIRGNCSAFRNLWPLNLVVHTVITHLHSWRFTCQENNFFWKNNDPYNLCVAALTLRFSLWEQTLPGLFQCFMSGPFAFEFTETQMEQGMRSVWICFFEPTGTSRVLSVCLSVAASPARTLRWSRPSGLWWPSSSSNCEYNKYSQVLIKLCVQWRGKVVSGNRFFIRLLTISLRS